MSGFLLQFQGNLAAAESNLAKAELSKIKTTESIQGLNKIRNYQYYGVTEGLFVFYLQDLVSKSLIYDNGLSGMGAKPHAFMEITEFGCQFLKYIESV